MGYQRIPASILRAPSNISNYPQSMVSVQQALLRNLPGSRFYELVQSVPVLLAIQSDLGITLNGSGVSAWADQSGNGNNLTQGTAAKQPLYAINGLNGFPTITWDGVDDEMSSAGPNLPAPGTTNTFYWAVLKQPTWTAGETLWQANLVNGLQVAQRTAGASPEIFALNPTAGPANTGAAVGAWVRGEFFFSNSTSDYVKLGAVTASGTNLGNNDPGAGIFFGRNSGGTTFANMSLAAFMITAGKPSTAELAALSSAVNAKYGSSVGAQ